MEKQIQNFLSPAHPWKGQVHWFDTLTSTNTEAKAMAAAGAPHGTVVIADKQTGGRGRMGRSFCSLSKAGVYLSVILRPPCESQKLMHLTCAAGVAMCDAIARCSGFRPQIKWVNDLIANGKKLGGILTELSVDSANGFVRYAVVGIGINCTQEAEDFPPELRDIAVSLQSVTGKPVCRRALMGAMIDALWEMDCKLLSDKSAVMEAYRKNCITLGQDIYLIRGDKKVACRAFDLDAEGSLIVEYPDGSKESVCSGEVSVRRM